jgi:hypothetical protein
MASAGGRPPVTVRWVPPDAANPAAIPMYFGGGSRLYSLTGRNSATA